MTWRWKILINDRICLFLTGLKCPLSFFPNCTITLSSCLSFPIYNQIPWSASGEGPAWILMSLLILRVCLCWAQSVSDVCPAQTSHPPIHKWAEYNILKFHTLSKPVWGEGELHENMKVLEVTGIYDNYLFCLPPPDVLFVSVSIIADFEMSEGSLWHVFSSI